MRLYPLGIEKKVFIFVLNSIVFNVKSMVVLSFPRFTLIFISFGNTSS